MTDTTQTQNNQPTFDTDFENIVPWNGANDFGRDVRLKWERNFEKIKVNFLEIIDFVINANDRYIRKDKEDVTEFLLRLLGGVKIGKHLTLGDFITGMQGGYIDEKGRAELESLVLRSELIVPAIRYNYMTEVSHPFISAI